MPTWNATIMFKCDGEEMDQYDMIQVLFEKASIEIEMLWIERVV